jgi:hypothetical protein
MVYLLNKIVTIYVPLWQAQRQRLLLCLPPTKLSPYGECHQRLEDEDKEEEEEEKFSKETVTSDVCFTSQMVCLSVIMLKTAICFIKICIKEHESVLWIFSKSICTFLQAITFIPLYLT